jgi:hypothetical protein
MELSEEPTTATLFLSLAIKVQACDARAHPPCTPRSRAKQCQIAEKAGVSCSAGSLVRASAARSSFYSRNSLTFRPVYRGWALMRRSGRTTFTNAPIEHPASCRRRAASGFCHCLVFKHHLRISKYL